MRQKILKNTLKVLNEVKRRKIIKDYAIGGGIATLYYIEAFLTYDLDIFFIPEKKEGQLLLLDELFSFFKKRNYKWKGEHIIIEGIPVQFIPADEIEEEAIKNAKQIKIEGIKTKIFSSEYLTAILFKTGREKDKERIRKILAEKKVDKRKLKNILKKFKLYDDFIKEMGKI